MDDTVQIRCHRCKATFRDKARRVQSGYSRQCPSCETILFFEESAIDRNVQRALREAKHLRTALREEELVRITSSSTGKPFVFRRQ
jgi:hypothetical protein